MQLLYLLISLLIVICDQSLKYYVVNLFSSPDLINNQVVIIKHIVSLTYVRNYGAAWNILTGQMWLFYLISIFALGACLYYLFNKKYKKIIFNLGLSFVIGGILGNFIDRLHLKYVIDMIQLDFINFNIFNIADSAISIGIFLIMLYLIFYSEQEQKKKGNENAN